MRAKKLQKRLNVLLGIVIAIFVVLTISLSALQIVKGDEYEKLAEENRIRIIPITAPRGVFKDRNGRELVNNRPSFTVSYMSVKTERETQEEVFAILRDILDIPAYTEVSNEKRTVNEDKRIYLSKLPVWYKLV
jgi:penicillin-binding protein 2